ncbi:MAG: pyrroloquinoline quinone biosynthesis protein PqqB [Bacteroidia bacterium]|nr:pyrroloquinoline quinone biosynthesis protein PqqB [Bacteroidia bacterium]
MPGDAPATTTLYILGTSQDGGYPQMGCARDCCRAQWTAASSQQAQYVACLGLFDPGANARWLFEATPDIKEQWHLFSSLTAADGDGAPDGIFLTHAHMGHYLGLAQLGFESMNARNVPVYAMPRMKSYLESNGPWSQLVGYHNIDVQPLQDQTPVTLASHISVTPFMVPHRDEFSETVGYSIRVGVSSVAFIPDIDKWSKWNHSIDSLVRAHTYLLVDGTFYDGHELPNRDIAQVPHPLISETMEQLKALPTELKDRIYFIHFNHTNPVWQPGSEASRAIGTNGFHVARQGMAFNLE